MPPAEFENTDIKTYVDGRIFQTKGKVLKSKGYLEVYNKEDKSELLPSVEKGEEVDVLGIAPVEKQTTPPKSYTEDTLLKAMKNCGKNVSDDDTTVLSGYSIGTSATRADVLKKIKDVGYVKKKGKSYYITELGINLVEIFPVKELLDVDFTGKLEKSLSDIQKGQFTRKEYLNNICSFVVRSVNTMKMDSRKNINTEHYVYSTKYKKYVKESSLKSMEEKSKASTKTTKAKKLDSSSAKTSSSKSTSKDSGEKQSLGKCPVCGSDVYEYEKGFFCENYKECRYGIWNEDQCFKKFKKKPNKTMVKSLLKKGEAKVKSFTDASGNKFDAIVKYQKNPANGAYCWIIERI